MRAEPGGLEALTGAYGEGDAFPLAVLGAASAAAKLDALLATTLAGAPQEPPKGATPRSAMLDALLGLVSVRRAFGAALADLLAAAPALPQAAAPLDAGWDRELFR